MRLTVGPLPPAVYWRRRALVLGVALAILFVVFQACNAVSSRGERAAPGEQPASSAPPSPTTAAADPTPTGTSPPATSEVASPPPVAEPAAGGAPECTNEDILVTAGASRTELGVGEVVRFTITIRNDSDHTCRRDIGGDHRELYLSAGGNTVWSSRACDPPTGSEVRELFPGFESAHHIDWDGRTLTSCEPGPRVQPGEYELRARLGTDVSEPVTIVVR